jgi:pyruvate formate lyase activating enzyme
MKGNYHSVETFGTVDGKGIRYVLFVTGCALGCRFCHNPDTWEPGGQVISVEEVLADYQKYRVYYEASGGGLTVSGGEPLLQPGFVAGLFAACRREGIHTTLDTAGFAPRAAIEAVLPYTDAVLFGLKAADGFVHRHLTGKTNKDIIGNLEYAVGFGVPLTLRYIIIPGMTDRPEELKQLAELIARLPGKVPVELLPYHILGRGKWECLGRVYPLADTRQADANDLERAKYWLADYGITEVSF